MSRITDRSLLRSKTAPWGLVVVASIGCWSCADRGATPGGDQASGAAVVRAVAEEMWSYALDDPAFQILGPGSAPVICGEMDVQDVDNEIDW